MIEIDANDLCNEINRSMKIMFDIFTPRPHFIIIQRDEFRKINVTDQQIDDLFELIHQFLIHKSQYDNNAILSFHRGVWYQQKQQHFHAHLCVSKKPYCQEVKTMIDNDGRLSSNDYLNQLDDDYLVSKVQYKRYQSRCLSKAYLYLNHSIAARVPLEEYNTSKFTLVYLASTPRIGILAKNTQINLRNLYFFMNNFYLTVRKKLSLINRSYENFGAHLCLYVSGKSQISSQVIQRSDRILVNDINLIKTVRLVGYIQIDEQLYLRWLPNKFQLTWLEQFQSSQHFVST